MSRWLVVGCDGMLGQDLVAALGLAGDSHKVTAVDHDVLDIRDPDALSWPCPAMICYPPVPVG